MDFNGLFNQFMGGIGHFAGDIQQQRAGMAPSSVAAEANKTPPPASIKYINDLKPNPVTADDVQEANNKEC